MNFLRRMTGRQKPLIRVLRMEGAIKSGQGKYVNIFNMEKQIEEAFDCKKTKPKAVILEINSKGGSPAQSNMIYSRIRNLADKNNLPVITFIEEIAVSGGYWLALAGDEIYADKTAAVAHIGALNAYFGMEEAIKKLGLEWRLLTAGKHKMRLDPFRPPQAENTEWMQNFLDQLHAQFIALVKERRKTLDLHHKTVFEADIFNGETAAKIGLIDGTCSDINALMKERYGEDVQIQRVKSKWKFPFMPWGASTKLTFDTEKVVEALADISMNSRYKTY